MRLEWAIKEWRSGRMWAPRPDKRRSYEAEHEQGRRLAFMDGWYAALAASREERAGLDAHEPGDNHEYRIECKVCGQYGTIRLAIEPQHAIASDTPEAGQ